MTIKLYHYILSRHKTICEVRDKREIIVPIILSYNSTHHACLRNQDFFLFIFFV